MPQQSINAGFAVGDGTPDILRGHFDKADANFTELYATVAAAQADATEALTWRGAVATLSGFQSGADYSSAPAIPFDTLEDSGIGFTISGGGLCCRPACRVSALSRARRSVRTQPTPRSSSTSTRTARRLRPPLSPRNTWPMPRPPRKSSANRSRLRQQML